MAMEVNGSAILNAMAKDPASFMMTETQVNDVARGAIASKLKHKDTKLFVARAILSQVGAADFGLVLDVLKSTELAALCKKLDAKHSELKSADSTWHRTHILNLATGKSEPTPPPSKPVKAKPAASKPSTPRMPKIGKIMGSEAQKSGGRSRGSASKKKDAQ